ncbi:glycerophosphodiester phosphodiesterase [Niveispirillum sp.]|uniref:glycerophosphodiester phosphodiesterase n=1 Tax=Niveispirillum sp. TaxID=1917217 RepID=UPI001B476D61|nr:glycerophosphodiester phosphodiesterase [Niveispirillum sp.]MBP7334641.1 glycerophosphodiester phosphodiesterase [Niveispirillum sp.]
MRAATRHPYLDHPGPIPFAHRGGGREAPENSMTAFARAVDLGYRYMETDVQVTADGRLIVFHDPVLDGLTDGQGRVGTLPWSEVSQARVGGREPIPLLDELLETWPDLRLNIDPKSDMAAEALAVALRRHGALDRVCVGSFSGGRLAGLRRALGPDLCSSAGPWDVARIWAAGHGLPVPPPRGPHCLQVPVSHRGLTVVTPGMLRAAHACNLPVHVWTVDEVAEMERLLDLGVDGLITDRPTLLRDVLVRRGLWAG